MTTILTTSNSQLFEFRIVGIKIHLIQSFTIVSLNHQQRKFEIFKNPKLNIS